MPQLHVVSSRKMGRSRSRVGWAVPVLLGLAACDGPGTTGPVPDPGNVEFRVGAQVEQSDTAVVVDGRSIVRFPPSPTLRLERFHVFDFGGFPEHNYPQQTRQTIGWRIGMSHQHPPLQRNDSTILRFADYGDASVAGSLMEKHTGLPHVAPGTPVRFENFVSYLTMAYAHADWMDGRTTTFTRAGYFDELLAGAPLRVEITGSEEVGPASGEFSARRFAELVGLANGRPIPLDGPMPEIDVNQSLVLSFDRPLDPEHAWIVLYPFGPPGQSGGRHAFVQPQSATHNVVIPAERLRELVAEAGAPRLAYRLVIQEAHVRGPVFAARFRDGSGEVPVPFVQQSQATVHFRLAR